LKPSKKSLRVIFAIASVVIFFASKLVNASAQLTESRAQSYFHFIVGSLASFDNDSTAALEHYRAASEADPDSNFLVLKVAEENLNLSRTVEARDLLTTIKKTESKNPDYFVLEARLGSQESDLNMSLKALDQAISLFLEQGNAIKAREMVLTKVALLADNHEYNQSVASLEKFLKQQPDDEIGYYFLGKIHTIFQNRLAAKKAFRRAISIRSGFLAASKALGLQLELEGKLKEAIGVYQSALRGGANDEELIQKLINLSLIGEDYAASLEYLKQYIMLRPDDIQNQMRAGLIHYKLKHYSEAEAVFENVLKTQTSGQDRTLFYLGSLHQEQGNFEKAVTYLEKVTSSSEYFVESELQVANILLYKLNQSEQAADKMKVAIDKKPESPELILALGTVYEQSQKMKEATDLLGKASEKFEDNEKILFMLGSLLDRSGDFDGSIKVMRRVLANNMNNAHALNHIGYSYADRGINLEEAEGLLKRAIQLAPDNGFIVDSLGWTYFHMAKYKKALEFLERADKLSPNQAVILEHLADTYQKCGKKHQALEVYKRIMRTSVAKDEAKPSTDTETKSVQERVREKMAQLDLKAPN
jgi:tetratricopeptide (TPR) repeat protein